MPTILSFRFLGFLMVMSIGWVRVYFDGLIITEAGYRRGPQPQIYSSNVRLAAFESACSSILV